MEHTASIDYTILAVDDSAPMRQLISFTLRGAGYKVIEALDGKDAVNKMEESKVDLIITDLNMPNMDGMELLRYLRSQDSFSHIPVVILTTESQASTIVTAKKMGISGWIIKPFEPMKLTETVVKILK